MQQHYTVIQQRRVDEGRIRIVRELRDGTTSISFEGMSLHDSVELVDFIVGSHPPVGAASTPLQNEIRTLKDDLAAAKFCLSNRDAEIVRLNTLVREKDDANRLMYGKFRTAVTLTRALKETLDV